MTLKESINQNKLVTTLLSVMLLMAIGMANQYLNVNIKIEDIDRLNNLLETMVNSTFYSLQKPYDYIISQVGSHFCLQNGNTGKLQKYSTNLTLVEHWAIGNLTATGAGTIFLKNLQFDVSLTDELLETTLVIQSYNGAFTYYIGEAPYVPPQSGNYTWIFDKSGSNYEIKYGNGTSLYNNTNSATSWNHLLGSGGIASTSDSIHVLSGAYAVPSSWNIYIASVQVTFDSGAIMTLANGVNTQPMMAIHANGVIIYGGVFDGNAANQTPAAHTLITANYWTGETNGILIYGSNCLIEYATVHDCRCCGIVAMSPSGDSLGVMNCTVYNIGANGIMAGWTDTNLCYFINNKVSYCGDVGIDSYGWDTKIVGNIIWETDYYDIPYYGAVNSGWGISVEGTGGSTGNYLLIANNRITDSRAQPSGNGGAGIALEGGAPARCLVQGNWIYNNKSVAQWEGIRCTSISNCHIEYNYIRNFTRGIGINSGSTNNVYNNTFSLCSTNYYDGGSGDTTNAPTTVVLSVTSSPQGVDFVEANGIAGYAGTYSRSPYIFYATVGGSVTIAAIAGTGRTFSSWSDSGVQTHIITVPATNKTYTATFT